MIRAVASETNAFRLDVIIYMGVVASATKKLSLSLHASMLTVAD